jgi:hypothetical protein
LSGQYLEQMTPELRAAVLGNIGTLVVFRVGSADAARLVSELLPDLDPFDLTLLPNRTFWIRPLVNGESVEAFTGRTLTLNEKTKDPLAGQQTQASHR